MPGTGFTIRSNMLELYQFEDCPYCRRVRQKMTDLGLSFIAHTTTDPEVKKRLVELGGKDQVPMLVDPKHDTIMYESADIIAHLEKYYGSKTAEA